MSLGAVKNTVNTQMIALGAENCINSRLSLGHTSLGAVTWGERPWLYVCLLLDLGPCGSVEHFAWLRNIVSSVEAVALRRDIQSLSLRMIAVDSIGGVVSVGLVSFLAA